MALAKTGVDVAICDIDDEAAAATRKEVEALGRRILSVHADVCDVDEFDKFYDAVEAQFDGLGIVVNIAGGGKSKSLTETTREQNAREIRMSNIRQRPTNNIFGQLCDGRPSVCL
jgi:3-oxoacyl-[acyl-carrier protein] reductase